MTDIEAIRQQWNHFDHTVHQIAPGDVESFRRVNTTLGYNIAQTVPTLVDEVTRQAVVIALLEERLASWGLKKC
jgi:hypothetical protein